VGWGNERVKRQRCATTGFGGSPKKKRSERNRGAEVGGPSGGGGGGGGWWPGVGVRTKEKGGRMLVFFFRGELGRKESKRRGKTMAYENLATPWGGGGAIGQTRRLKDSCLPKDDSKV